LIARSIGKELVLVVTNQEGAKIRDLELVMAVTPDKLYIKPEERVEII
jgi:hypothetical protein